MEQLHVSLLTKGPKYTPTVSKSKFNFKSYLKDFTRKVKIHELFSDKDTNDISIHRNNSNKQFYTQNQEINNICNFIELLQPEKMFGNDNLTSDERDALKELTSNENIIIKKSHKSGNFVIMDKSFYRDTLVLQGHLHSDTYEKVPDPMTVL